MPEKAQKHSNQANGEVNNHGQNRTWFERVGLLAYHMALGTAIIAAAWQPVRGITYLLADYTSKRLGIAGNNELGKNVSARVELPDASPSNVRKVAKKLLDVFNDNRGQSHTKLFVTASITLGLILHGVGEMARDYRIEREKELEKEAKNGAKEDELKSQTRWHSRIRSSKDNSFDTRARD